MHGRADGLEWYNQLEHKFTQLIVKIKVNALGNLAFMNP
jgi:hypothetical protein